MHTSFINHAGYRYLYLSLFTVLSAVAAYWWHEPQPVANGGTWLGFTLGGISAFLILMLLWLGVRKRRYSSKMGTVRGWLSAHVYLGLSLVVLATLHTGFQFHWNIHTLAYALMMTVVFSGIWGMILYLRNPRQMTETRNQQSREMTAGLMRELDEECLQLADRCGAETHDLISSALAPLASAGTWTRLRGKRGAATASADRHFNPAGETWKLESQLAEQLAQSRDPDKVTELYTLIETIGRRRSLSVQLGRKLRLQAQMEIWLMLHVPLSLGLLAALISHVVSVFFYR